METTTALLDLHAIAEHILTQRRRYHVTHGGPRLTQDRLAAKAAISAGHLARIERGEEDNPGIVTLEKIAKALDIPLPTLLYGDAHM